MRSRLARWGLLFLLWAGPAFGQGCAMCYSSAAGTSKDGQRALSRAVLVMLVLPLGVMTAGMRWAFLYGKKRDEENNGGEEKESPS